MYVVVVMVVVRDEKMRDVKEERKKEEKEEREAEYIAGSKSAGHCDLVQMAVLDITSS